MPHPPHSRLSEPDPFAVHEDTSALHHDEKRLIARLAKVEVAKHGSLWRRVAARPERASRAKEQHGQDRGNRENLREPAHAPHAVSLTIRAWSFVISHERNPKGTQI